MTDAGFGLAVAVAVYYLDTSAVADGDCVGLMDCVVCHNSYRFGWFLLIDLGRAIAYFLRRGDRFVVPSRRFWLLL